MSEKKGFLNLASVVNVAIIRQRCLHMCACGEKFDHSLGKPSKDIRDLLALRCEKTLKCEKCFILEKRKKQIQLIANGRRFRYTVPASSLPRVPLGHSSNKGFRVSFSR